MPKEDPIDTHNIYLPAEGPTQGRIDFDIECDPQEATEMPDNTVKIQQIGNLPISQNITIVRSPQLEFGYPDSLDHLV